MAIAGVSTQTDGAREKVVTVNVDDDDATGTTATITFQGAAPGGCVAGSDLIGVPTDYGYTEFVGVDNHVAQSYTISGVTAAQFDLTKITGAAAAGTRTLRLWFRCPRGVAR